MSTPAVPDTETRTFDVTWVREQFPSLELQVEGRAAAFLVRLLQEGVRPVIARVVIPALVRGDELITKSGCYGDLIREAQRIERPLLSRSKEKLP